MTTSETAAELLTELLSGQVVAGCAHDTPAGRLTLVAIESGLISVAFREPRTVATRLGVDPAVLAAQPDPSTASARWLDLARRELDAYFAGELREFTVPVDLRLASAFDRTVLDKLTEQIGYGQTTSYGQLAAALGLPPAASQQIGQAMAKNPVLVVVPCHRVLGADGSLVGYAGGLPAKRRMLDLEAADKTPMLDLGL